MTPTKLLIGQILVVFAIMVLGVWAATQWAAASLGYQARLGPAWFVVGGVPVYRPWALFGWWLFAAAELRLGEGRQQVVRIVRTPAGAGRRSRKGGR